MKNPVTKYCGIIVMIGLLLASSLISGCSSKPAEPTFDNPFDPDGVLGDPFDVTALVDQLDYPVDGLLAVGCPICEQPPDFSSVGSLRGVQDGQCEGPLSDVAARRLAEPGLIRHQVEHVVGELEYQAHLPRPFANRLDGVPVALLPQPDVDDILAAVAGARLFVGSSLHGNLVAMVYGVPHIGFGEQVRKLDLMLRTWDRTSPEGAVEPASIAERCLQALAADRAGLPEKITELRAAARTSFDEQASLVNG